MRSVLVLALATTPAAAGPAPKQLPNGLALAAIEGKPPSKLAAVAIHQVYVDDLVIVAMVGTTVTRVMFPEDRASAQRWLAAIRRDGFPPPAIVAGNVGYRAALHWPVIGDVEVKGGCTTVRSPITYAAHFQLQNPVVLVPAGTAPGRYVVFATQRFEGGPCGATHRALRLYRVPASHATTAIPQGAVPLIP